MADLHLAAGPRTGPVEKDRVYLCFDWEAYAALSAAGADVRAWEDFIREDTVRPLSDHILKVADGWHRDGAEDLSLHAGLSLGRAIRWMLWTLVLHPAYKFHAALLEAVGREAPRRVYCDGAVSELYRRIATEAASGRFEFVVFPGSPELDDVWRRFDARGGASLRHRAAALALDLARLPRTKSNARPALLLSYYHVFDQLIEEMSADSPLRLIVADAPDKSKLATLARAGARLWIEPHLAKRDAGSPLVRRLTSQWRSEKAAPLFAWRGASPRAALDPYFDRLLEQQLAPLAARAEAVEAEWNDDKPAAVLLPFAGPPLQNLILQLANRDRVPSVMLLHGLATFDFPLERGCGNLIVWGPEQPALYRRHEPADERRIIPAGNTNFDRYAGAAREENGPLRRVLVLTHPKDRSFLRSSGLDDARFALTVVDELERQGDWQVTLKLHPSEDPGFYRKLLAGRKVEIVRDGVLIEHLREADFVVGPFTTALLEASLMGKPILCVNLGREPFPAPFDGNWGVELITSAEGLRARLERLRAEPDAECARIRASARRMEEGFAGPRDGSATRRVLEALYDLAKTRA